MPSFPRTLGLLLVGVAATSALTGCGTGLVTRDLTRVPPASAEPSSSDPAPSATAPSSTAPSTSGVAPAPPSSSSEPTAPLIPPGITAYGDSVMLGAKAELTRRGVAVDAVESRQFHSGVGLVTVAATKGTLPVNVVVHLGTNGSLAVKDCHAIVDAAGPQRRVFFLTAHAPRSWIAVDNANLRTCAAGYPDGRVVVIDWNKPASTHPAWFYSDGIHLNGKGRTAYAAVLGDAVDRLRL